MPAAEDCVRPGQAKAVAKPPDGATFLQKNNSFGEAPGI
jgi:hypothetical protein